MNERAWWVVVFFVFWIALLVAIDPAGSQRAPAWMIGLLAVGCLIAVFRGPIRFR